MKTRYVFLGEDKPDWMKRKEGLVRKAVKTKEGIGKIQESFEAVIKSGEYILNGCNDSSLRLEYGEFISGLRCLHSEADEVKSKNLKEREDFGEKILRWTYKEHQDSIVAIFSFGRLENDK